MNRKKNRLEHEKATIHWMVEFYCVHKLKCDTMPDEYRQLVDYACRRLDHCRWQEAKPACKKCPVHCYAPDKREAIRKVMRWVGPRMIIYSPIDAIKHLFGI